MYKIPLLNNFTRNQNQVLSMWLNSRQKQNDVRWQQFISLRPPVSRLQAGTSLVSFRIALLSIISHPETTYWHLPAVHIIPMATTLNTTPRKESGQMLPWVTVIDSRALTSAVSLHQHGLSLSLGECQIGQHLGRGWDPSVLGDKNPIPFISPYILGPVHPALYAWAHLKLGSTVLYCRLCTHI